MGESSGGGEDNDRNAPPAEEGGASRTGSVKRRQFSARRTRRRAKVSSGSVPGRILVPQRNWKTRELSCWSLLRWSRNALLVCLGVVFSFLVGYPEFAAPEGNKNYRMDSLCQDHFLQQVYQKIDGAILRSQNELNLECVVTFQTDSILQKFMIRFDRLQLDCNDHLFIYDGAYASGDSVDLSCRQTKESFGVQLTNSNFITLRYLTDSWGTESNGFSLVITAFKELKHGCRDFICDQRNFCISNDLVCDGINHCEDGSDESTLANCLNTDLMNVFGIKLSMFITVSVAGVLLVCLSLVGLTVCMFRRSGNYRRAASSASAQQTQLASYPRAAQLHHNTAPNTALQISENTQLPAGLDLQYLGSYNHSPVSQQPASPAAVIARHHIRNNSQEEDVALLGQRLYYYQHRPK